MVAANITYDLIINACKSGFEELSKLLSKYENGHVKVTKDKRVLTKLFNYLKDSFE